MSLPGKPRDHDSAETGGDSFESSESLLQSWNSQSSLLDVQRVPSFESFEDDCSQSLGLSKPTMSFKDYIQDRSDPVEQGKPVIPAAVLAGFTGACSHLVYQGRFSLDASHWRSRFYACGVILKPVSSLSRASCLPASKEATWTGMFVVAELSIVGANPQAAPSPGQSWLVPKRRGEQ